MELIEVARQHRKAGRLGDAAATLRMAVQRDPMNPEAWFQGGTLALDLREFAFAKTLFELCASAAPTDAMAIYNVGYCAFRLGDPSEAVSRYQRAVEIDPSFIRGFIALGQMLHIVGRPDEGRAAFERALALPAPTSSKDAELRALVRIARGEFVEGWKEFDGQWGTSHANGLAGLRLWDGTDAPDDTLYLLVDGGYGDTLLFARYAEVVRRRVNRVVAVVEPPLHRLARTIDGIDQVVAPSAALPVGSLVSGFWTLPRKTGTTVHTIPTRIPYVIPPDRGPVLHSTGSLRVGIAWFGGISCAHDFDRSCPDLSLLAPIFSVPGVEWHHLQPESARSAEAERFGIRPMPPVCDFADTAFMIRQLDLVITVDTAVANLSAALGVPTWIMIPTIPEFRWPLGASRSPWYPSARIFRRQNTWAWSDVGMEIASALHRRAQSGVDADLPAYRRWNMTP